MRVLLVPVLAALSLSVVACSGGTEDSTLRRAPSSPARSQAPSSSGDTTSSATPGPSTPPGPAGSSTPSAPDAGSGTPAPPAPPAVPAPGSCGAPKCFGLGGFGGCTAKDAAGVTVTLGCQDGACACLKGALTTSAFEGDVLSADDARQLFFANCDCD
jgi:hypothetical protein